MTLGSDGGAARCERAHVECRPGNPPRARTLRNFPWLPLTTTCRDAVGFFDWHRTTAQLDVRALLQHWQARPASERAALVHRRVAAAEARVQQRLRGAQRRPLGGGAGGGGAAAAPSGSTITSPSSSHSSAGVEEEGAEDDDEAALWAGSQDDEWGLPF